ncbi:MAG: carbon-nitrogen hydrolase family protein [Tumebacillaceae bacterium]
MSKTTYQVAIVTVPPVYLDLQASVHKACELIAEAAQNGAKLVVFGESWLPGYPFWVWLRSVPEAMPLTTRLFENSLEIDSRETLQLCQAARKHDIHVIMGINERDGGTLYNSLLFIDNEGNIPLVRRKLKPTGAERMVWGQGDGSGLTVVSSGIGVLGGHLCWEHTMHGLDAAFCALGEQVHVSAWPSFCLDLDYALGRDANAALAQAYAIRTQTFVINAATVVTQEIVDLVNQYEKDAQFFRTGGGYAQVFAPNGMPLMQVPDEHEVGIFYAEVNLELIKFAKIFCDATGHYTRPDVLEVTVNKAEQRPVTFVAWHAAEEDKEVQLIE